MLSERKCLACGDKLRGRIDKKFCNDNCRNNYNNALKSETTNLMRNINNALGKNRRILASILPENEEMKKVKLEKLLQLGFSLKYITQVYTTKQGKIYYYCYEYGYLPLEDDWFLIVKRNPDQS